MSDQTLDSSIPIDSDQPQPPLSRNSSFSKLNAKAPEFVSMKPAQSPPLLMIVPPPPPPPTAVVHVFPPTMPIPVCSVPHPNPHIHPHHQLHGNSNNTNNHNHSNNDRQYKKVSKQGDGVGSSQGGQVDKDQGGSGSNGGSNSNNGLSDEVAQRLIIQILTRRGDLGIFRNSKRDVTVPKEFAFQTAKRNHQNPPIELFSKNLARDTYAFYCAHEDK